MKCKKIYKAPMPQYGFKEWVYVEFNGEGEWVISFLELLEIVRRIGECEDEKYPFGEGRMMLADFLYKAIKFPSLSYEKLAEEFEIPDRNQGQYLLIGGK
jgi:hypothetical protein